MRPFDSARHLPLAPRLEQLCRAESGWFTHYLPVEFFKWCPEELKPQDVAACFLSSGTTQQDRSRSYFSKSGLAQYRTVALRSFHRVLSDFFSPSASVQGLSLVPPVEQWPDSSLARMVGWIAEETPVTYLPDDPDLWPNPSPNPVWVFGTGFHFVNLMDAGVRFPLPKGSVVIETGGTKGRSRSVTREELYEGIARVFAIPTSAIVSEYGMCELASQAYDWVKPGHDIPFHERRFRFPEHVQVFMHEGQGRFQRSGTGSLSILDAARIDYPWCVRTQDLATVWEDGSFRLEGRVPQAILKGCSLPFEKVAAAGEIVPQKRTLNSVNWDEAAARHRLPTLLAAWNQFLDDSRLRPFLENEWGSRQLADWALQDLRHSAPKTSEDWIKAAKASLGSALKSPTTWLLILPQTHAFTAFHPMLLGLLAGCRFYVRPAQKNSESVEGLWLATIARFFPESVHCLSSAFYLGTDPLPSDADALLCFASDETVARLKNVAGVPIQGFGNALTLSLLQEPFAATTAEKLAKDAFSLGQRGCLSSRLGIVITEGDGTALAREILNAIDLHLPTSLAQALDHEAVSRCFLDEKCQTIRKPNDNGPLVCVHPFHHGKDVASLISQRPFVLPLLVVSPKDQKEVLQALRTSFPALRHVTSHSLRSWADPGVSLRELGKANAPLWDGTHEGRPFFAIEAKV